MNVPSWLMSIRRWALLRSRRGMILDALTRALAPHHLTLRSSWCDRRWGGAQTYRDVVRVGAFAPALPIVLGPAPDAPAIGRFRVRFQGPQGGITTIAERLVGGFDYRDLATRLAAAHAARVADPVAQAARHPRFVVGHPHPTRRGWPDA